MRVGEIDVGAYLAANSQEDSGEDRAPGEREGEVVGFVPGGVEPAPEEVFNI